MRPRTVARSTPSTEDEELGPDCEHKQPVPKRINYPFLLLLLTLAGLAAVALYSREDWPDGQPNPLPARPGELVPGPTDIAFFMQLNQINDKGRLSINTVRRLLPKAPFYVLSDGGPDFSADAKALDIHAERAPFRTHLADYMPPFNFTCKNHLERFAAAATWAEAQGAKYLMLWEEDTRLLHAPRYVADVDQLTMGNIANTGSGMWVPKRIERLRATSNEKLTAPELRRKPHLDRYEAMHGYASGPGSAWRIESFLRAYRNASQRGDIDDGMFNIQDQCWSEFAVNEGLSMEPWREMQQWIEPYVESDPHKGPFLLANLRCMQCLDQCKDMCVCAPPYSLLQTSKFVFWRLLYMFTRYLSLARRQSAIMERPCHSCERGSSCWSSCKSGCDEICPAVIHPHKGSTVDCSP